LNSTFPDHAFILAAGMGKRLQPYTDTMPKPLVKVNGKPMIDHTLDALEKIGVGDVTVNLHYRAAQLQDHLSKRRSPAVTFSLEDSLLDTGGGIKKALYTMGGKPFFVFSGDTLWEDGPSGNALKNLAAAWDDKAMDLLLLLQPVDKMAGGIGDYDIVNGKPVRSLDKTGRYFWPSIRICHPRLFDNTAPEGTPFSFLELMDRAEKAGRLGVMVHDGTCHHITAPEDLHRVNAHFLQHPPQYGGPKPA
jgi:MurNAc alpha-1-phosphate uridylyltransferase